MKKKLYPNEYKLDSLFYQMKIQCRIEFTKEGKEHLNRLGWTKEEIRKKWVICSVHSNGFVSIICPRHPEIMQCGFDSKYIC